MLSLIHWPSNWQFWNPIKQNTGPLKHCYAKEHNLNFEELMSDGAYKEQYRSDMVTWSEGIRFDFYSIFKFRRFVKAPGMVFMIHFVVFNCKFY